MKILLILLLCSLNLYAKENLKILSKSQIAQIKKNKSKVKMSRHFDLLSYKTKIIGIEGATKEVLGWISTEGDLQNDNGFELGYVNIKSKVECKRIGGEWVIIFAPGTKPTLCLYKSKK